MKTLRVVAALIGFAIVLVGWGIYYYSEAAYSSPLHAFDPSEIDRIVKQLRELVEPASAVIGSHFCDVIFKDIPKKVYLNRAFNLSATVSLPDKVENCTSAIAVIGAAFSIEPKAETKVSLDQQARTRTVIFNLLPSKPGKQVFVYGYDQTAKQAETTVYEYSFINPELSLWFPILGTFFGGALTLPWWLELFGIPKSKDERGKKEKPRRKKKKATQLDQE